MKTYKKLIISFLAVLSFVTFVGSAHAMTLSQNSISLTAGQTSTVYVYNVSGYLSISSNTNPNIATVTINGNNLNVYGVMTGNTTATICDSVSGCSVLYITVSGYYGYNNGTNNSGLNLSNVTLSIGSSITISPSNNYNYSYYNNTNGLYVSSNSNPTVASATNSSSGIIPGCYGTNTYSITTGQLCNNIPATPYNGTSYIPGCYAGALYSITTGQPCNSYNNTSINSNYQVVGCYGTNLYSVVTGQPCNGSSTNRSGSILITALSAGTDSIVLCQNGSTCSTINVLVNGGYYGTPTNSSYYYGDNPSSTSGVPVIYSTSSAN